MNTNDATSHRLSIPGDGRRLPVVYLVRPRCEACESVDLRTYKSMDNGDDSRTWWCKCRCCGQNFKIVWE